jgi:multidrug efflux system outer membrane protein
VSPVPDAWPTGAAYDEITAAKELLAAPEVAWRELFTDERLQKVIEIALSNNRDLRLATLNVEKARGLYGIQRAELFPAIAAAGSGSKERVPADLSTTGKSMIKEQYSVNLGVTSWEIDLFGRIRSLKDQALQEYLATEQGQRGAKISLISAVAEAYLTLAADRGNLKLARSTLEAQQSAYGLIKRRYDVGLATEIDLYRAQTQVDAARGDAARYTQLTAQDHNALNLLAGIPVPEELLPEELVDVAPLKDISPGLSSEVLLNRPDIMAAEHRLKGAYAYIGAARAALFPRIALTTSVGTASAELSGLFEAGSATWSFAPRISMPIFDARAWAALQVSKAQQKILLTTYERVIQGAFREVADVLAVCGTVDQRVSAQQSLVDAVTETLRLSNARYMKGIDSYLSVLDAQRSLYSSRQGLIVLSLAKLVSQVRLYAILGGGA